MFTTKLDTSVALIVGMIDLIHSNISHLSLTRMRVLGAPNTNSLLQSLEVADGIVVQLFPLQPLASGFQHPNSSIISYL